MKSVWVVPTVLCLLAGTALPQTGETRQQRGKRVVDQALEALGGDAFLHMQDRVETGRAYSFYRDEISGLSVATIYTRYLAPVPGKVEMREREAFGKKQDEGALLFTEKAGWDISFRGARPLPDERYKNYQDSLLHNIFYILHSRLNEPGMTFYSQLSDRYENQPVEIVDITDAESRTVTVYFNRSSKLPVKQSFRRRNETYGDFDTETTIYAKYRTVSGVQWPFDIRRDRNGQKTYEMYADSVEINKDLGDELFTLPANMKVLPVEK
jgi:hypothetical protein